MGMGASKRLALMLLLAAIVSAAAQMWKRGGELREGERERNRHARDGSLAAAHLLQSALVHLVGDAARLSKQVGLVPVVHANLERSPPPPGAERILAAQRERIARSLVGAFRLSRSAQARYFQVRALRVDPPLDAEAVQRVLRDPDALPFTVHEVIKDDVRDMSASMPPKDPHWDGTTFVVGESMARDKDGRLRNYIAGGLEAGALGLRHPRKSLPVCLTPLDFDRNPHNPDQVSLVRQTKYGAVEAVARSPELRDARPLPTVRAVAPVFGGVASTPGGPPNKPALIGFVVINMDCRTLLAKAASYDGPAWADVSILNAKNVSVWDTAKHLRSRAYPWEPCDIDGKPRGVVPQASAKRAQRGPNCLPAAERLAMQRGDSPLPPILGLADVERFRQTPNASGGGRADRHVTPDQAEERTDRAYRCDTTISHRHLLLAGGDDPFLRVRITAQCVATPWLEYLMYMGICALLGTAAWLLHRIDRQRARTRSVLETAHDGILAVGPDMRVLAANDVAVRLMGARPGMRGQTLSSYWPSNPAPQALHATLSRIAQQPEGEVTEIRLSDRSVEVYATENAADPDHAFTVSLRDVSEQRKAEAALRRYTADLEQADVKHRENQAELKRVNTELQLANEEREKFLRYFSHDVRHPIAVVKNWSSLAVTHRANENKVTRDWLLEKMSSINRSAHWLDELFDSILKIRDIKEGKTIALNQELLGAEELKRLGQEWRDQAESLCRASECSILIAEPTCTAMQVYADPLLLRRSVGNLVTNAVKFTDAGGQITVDMRPSDDGRFTEFRVTDTGRGMAPEVADRVFDMFWRAPSVRDEKRGSGVGLASAQAFVRAMGGTIAIERTAPGEGSTFLVRLPAARDAVPEVPIDQTIPKKRTRPVALLIDDDTEVYTSLRGSFEQQGIDILHARTGTEGLRLARRAVPDVILLDVLLPDRGGLDVLRAVREDEALRDVPTIMISIMDEPSVARELGAVDYITKPLHPEALVQTVGSFLPGRGTNVLVVEDDDEERARLVAWLREKGCDVREARDGVEALAAVRARPPRVVLLDLVMPRMSGYEFLEQLDTDVRDSLDVIVLTGAADVDRQALGPRVRAIFGKDAVLGEPDGVSSGRGRADLGRMVQTLIDRKSPQEPAS